jgi:hypothetical protein
MKISKKTRVFIIYVIVFILAALLIGYLFFNRSIIEGANTVKQDAAQGIKEGVGYSGTKDITEYINKAKKDDDFKIAADALQYYDKIVKGLVNKTEADVTSGFKSLTDLYTANNTIINSNLAALNPPTDLTKVTDSKLAVKYCSSKVIDSMLQSAKARIAAAAYKNVNVAAVKAADTISVPDVSSKTYAANLLTNKVSANPVQESNDEAAAKNLLTIAADANAAKAIVAAVAAINNKYDVLGYSPPVGKTNIKPSIPKSLSKLKDYDTFTINTIATALTTLSSSVDNALKDAKITEAAVDITVSKRQI